LEEFFWEGQKRERFEVVALMQKLKLHASDFEELLIFLHHMHGYYIPTYPKFTQKSEYDEHRNTYYHEKKRDIRKYIVKGGPYGFQVLGVYLIYYDEDGQQQQSFLRAVRLEHGEKAQDLMDHWLEICRDWGLNPEFLIHASMDTASVNMGPFKGFARLLAERSPYLHVSGCMCHKLGAL
jgi:hypothetical protein